MSNHRVSFLMTQAHTTKLQTGFNLFAFLHGEDVYALGGARHDEELSEAEMLAFLQMAVPHDAISAYRQGFNAAHYTTELSDGTVAIPGRLFGRLQQTGQVLSLFEGIFRRLDAPEDPLICLTIVRDGIPVNDDGPIYHNGSKESDTRFRHLFFAEQHATTLAHLAQTQYGNHGRGAVVAMANPKPSDPEYRNVTFLPVAQCNLTEPVWNDVRRLVDLYDPVTQMVIVFLGPKTDSVYRLQIPARRI
jgi:hypothetical protein